MQPTDSYFLYAVRKWMKMQSSGECIFGATQWQFSVYCKLHEMKIELKYSFSCLPRMGERIQRDWGGSEGEMVMKWPGCKIKWFLENFVSIDNPLGKRMKAKMSADRRIYVLKSKSNQSTTHCSFDSFLHWNELLRNTWKYVFSELWNAFVFHYFCTLFWGRLQSYRGPQRSRMHQNLARDVPMCIENNRRKTTRNKSVSVSASCPEYILRRHIENDSHKHNNIVWFKCRYIYHSLPRSMDHVRFDAIVCIN